jgi:phosphate-selective porin
MKKLLLLSLAVLFIAVFPIKSLAQNEEDSKDKIQELKDRLDGIDERLATDESDIAGLKKIKVSGYMQAQFEKYESSVLPKSTFYMRRIRIKTTYEATDGVKFVVQPDFVVGAVTLKDAYVVVNDPWLNTFQLYAGQFNRPNYEVEYSSSQREVPERSRIVKALYPGEREIGVKLEANPSSVPLKFQLAVVNGNFSGSTNKDIDNFKDIMARATYSVNMPESGLGIDFGAHTYIGKIRAISTSVLKSDYSADSKVNIGDGISRSWFGGELQLYYDFLGGMALKGEFIAGKNATAASDATKSNQIKNVSGYYLYFIKNIGSCNQFALRWENYDPNTKLSKDDIGSISGSSSSDLGYNVLTLAWQLYWDDNVRITFAYEMPYNEKTTKLTGYDKDISDNTFTLRFQSKF